MLAKNEVYQLFLDSALRMDNNKKIITGAEMVLISLELLLMPTHC